MMNYDLFFIIYFKALAADFMKTSSVSGSGCKVYWKAGRSFQMWNTSGGLFSFIFIHTNAFLYMYNLGLFTCVIYSG